MKINKKKYIVEALAQFPMSSKRSIASYLFQTYPTIFPRMESARLLIKDHTTPGGKRKGNKGIEHKTDFSNTNPFGIPEAQEREPLIVHLPDHLNNILWISDLHFPNHDKGAIETALHFGLFNQVDTIIIGGDLFDHEEFSRHGGAPPAASGVRKWFDMVDEFLQMLKDVFKCEVYWLEGNHDAWYKRYLISHAATIFHDEYYTLQSRMKLREKGIHWIHDTQTLMCGKLPVHHGHKIVKASVQPAKALHNKILRSMLIGHCHQTMEFTVTDPITREMTTCYSTGCLCDLAPGYDPFNKSHNLGFAHIKVNPDKTYKVSNIRIDSITKQIY